MQSMQQTCIVAISYGRTKTTSGCSWEIGYAYGIGKKVVVVEMDEGPQSLMVSNGSYATVKGIEGLMNYDFISMPKLMTEAEQKFRNTKTIYVGSFNHLHKRHEFVARGLSSTLPLTP